MAARQAQHAVLDRLVLYYSGSNERLAASLPATIDLPVTIDPTTRRIIGIDIDAAALELEPYRALAVEWYKRTDSFLAGPRNLASVPGDAVAAAKDAASAWISATHDAVADMANPDAAATRCSWSTDEIEAVRRNAVILAVRYQKKPKERQKAHYRAVQMLKMQLESLRAGAMSQADFDVMVMREEVSTAISADEARQFRRDAGL